ncbi:hypothetical protein, partial [Enorma sp.]|uniref:hypothetical protein n=1 Tax=Enorma sp. TaxID=1920692 RepID=UPI0025BD0FB3
MTLLLGKRGCGLPVAGITALPTRAVGDAHPHFPRSSVTNPECGKYLDLGMGRSTMYSKQDKERILADWRASGLTA